MRKIYAFLVLSVFVFSACEITVDEKDNDTTINDQTAQGMLSEGVDFTVVSALCKQTDFFGKSGYKFFLSDKELTCDSSYITSPINFFIETAGIPEVGTYSGDGPYIFYEDKSSSFMGCDVEITKVTDTMIEGKVKGGSKASYEYIEGSFSAMICTE